MEIQFVFTQEYILDMKILILILEKILHLKHIMVQLQLEHI